MLCSIEELIDQLDEIIERVERGEWFAITLNDKVVHKITPEPGGEQEAADGLRRYRESRERRKKLPRINATLEELMAWRHETSPR